MIDPPIPGEREIRTLAHEYDDAPIEPTNRRHRSFLKSYWLSYGDWLRERATFHRSYLDIRECRREAYEDGDSLLRDVTANGRLVVTHDYADHPYWDVETNMAQRLVHDLDGHAAAGAGFTWTEEIATLRKQRLVTPPRFWPAMFAQSLHQLASTTHNKKFPEVQKVILTTHAEFRASALGDGRALNTPGNLPAHTICDGCDVEHPHSHLKGEL